MVSTYNAAVQFMS